jgi:hypothetical protein
VDIYVVMGIEELTLEGLPGEGLELDNDCTITPNIGEVLALIDLPYDERGHSLALMTGLVNRETVSRGSAAVMVLQTSDSDLSNNQARRFLLRVIALAELFLFSLWLVKDNSGNIGDAILGLGVPADRMRAVFKQRPGVLNFTADSQRRPMTFSRAEIDVATRYFQQLNVVLPQIEWRLDAPRPTGLIYQSRIVRTLYFAQAARAAADFAVRAMYYGMALEALLSADTGRYSHNVPRRASVFLGSSRRERQQPYDDIYALYRYRSDVAHGTAFDQRKEAEIRATTRRCDSHLRTIVTHILDDATLLRLFRDGTNSELSRYFNEQPIDEIPRLSRHPERGSASDT